MTDTRAPACGRTTGDDSANPAGSGCNAEDLCAEGWHICLDINDVKAAWPFPTAGCTDSVPPGQNLWFATRQATKGCGRCADGSSVALSCNSAACTSGCLNTERTTNDVYGCGTYGAGGACGGIGMTWTGNLCGSIAPYGWSCNLPGPADDSGLCETYTLVHSNPSTGGVLCCKDATTPDTDGDGVGNHEDNCIGVYNPAQADYDQDGFGDVCDTYTCFDDDWDGICNQGDNCRTTPNADQADFDGDGYGDACDTDSDGDGVTDGDDVCLGTPVGEVVLANGCFVAQYCLCDAAWKNHGAYVSCVAHACIELVAAGLITGEEHGEIVSAAAQSECGVKAKKK